MSVADPSDEQSGPDLSWVRTPDQVHRGMPPLDLGDKPVSSFEFLPPRLFYVPVALHWLYLSLRFLGPTLPTAANPTFPLGGLVGEQKSQIDALLEGEARERFARTAVFNPAGDQDFAICLKTAQAVLKECALDYPFVAKPDRGCRGVGVRLIRNERQLSDYVSSFPAGHAILFQEYISHEAEAGIFYVRFPGEKEGRIISLAFKYFPHIFGDGRSSVQQLIERDPRAGQLSHLYFPRHRERLSHVLAKGEAMRLAFAGSHSRGAIFRNGNVWITDELARSLDKVADGIPGFCFGRFDVRFTSIDDLQKGEGFRIVEVNGAGGESIHIWDSRTTLREAYGSLRRQYRLVFEVGAANRRLGHKPASLLELLKAWRLEKRLSELYPATE